jgi:hypothetical protein
MTDTFDRDDRNGVFIVQAIRAHAKISKMLACLPIPIAFQHADVRNVAAAVTAVERAYVLIRDIPMDAGLRAEAVSVMVDWLTAVTLALAAFDEDDDTGADWMFRSAKMNVMRADVAAAEVRQKLMQ